MSPVFPEFIAFTVAIMFADFQFTATAPADSGQPPPSVNGSNSTTTVESPYSYLHQHCGFGVKDAKDCDPTANLVCDAVELSQWSICSCRPGMIPDELGTLVCKPPKKLISIGGKCKAKALVYEEECKGDLALCGPNGTCICGDDGSGNVLYDQEHNYCYLKSQRHHKLQYRTTGSGFKMEASCVLVCLLLEVFSIVKADLLN